MAATRNSEPARPALSLAGWLRARLDVGLLLAVFGILGLGLMIEHVDRTNTERRQHAEVEGQVNLLRARLEGLVRSDVQLLRGLVAAVEADPAIGLDVLERMAAELMASTGNVRLLAAAPDFVVEMLHPSDGNEAAAGLDYRAAEARLPVAIEAATERRLRLAGPIELLIGGQGLAVYAPVLPDAMGNGPVWGLMTAVIDIDSVYRASGVDDLGLDVAIRGRDGLGAEGEVFFGDPATFQARPVLARVELPEGAWVLAATPAGGWSTHSSNSRLIWIAVATLGALVIAPLAVAAKLSAERQSTIAVLEERERELARVSRRLDLALTASTVGVWEYNIDRDELVWDTRMNELYGMPEGQREHTYADWRGRLHLDDLPDAEETFRAAIEGRARYETQFRVVLPGGLIRHIQAVGAVYRDGDGTTKIVGVNWDVTANVEREAELLEKRREAEAASVTKSRFLAAMSHEIRTPMSGVLGMLDLLLDSPLDREQRSHAEVARASAATLLTILDDILDLSKLEADRFELDPANVQIDHVIDEVAALFQPMAAQKQLEITTEIATHVPTWLVCDPVRLRQIVVNLLSNAVKFTETGRITVRVDYSTRLERLTVAVIDTGIGISDEDARRLFQPFTQLETGLDRRAGGTGLGLAISHRLAELMGGSITLDSTPGRGSAFTVAVAAPRGRAAETPISEAWRASQPLRILLVEDNRTNQLIVTAMLERAGHTVTAAENGVAALAALDAGCFDAVLMDVEMPGMDGTAATRAIRSRPGPESRLPIIALTANAMAGDRERYLALGMTDYLSKPIDPTALHAALARAALTPAAAPRPDAEAARRAS